MLIRAAVVSFLPILCTNLHFSKIHFLFDAAHSYCSTENFLVIANNSFWAFKSFLNIKILHGKLFSLI